MNADFLIVGQGLTGSLVASMLEDHGYSILIYDALRSYSASQHAAGLINPISGRRFVKSWNYDQLEKDFKMAYQKIENKLNVSILRKHKIELCLTTVKEENDLLSQSVRYNYEHLLQLNESNNITKNIYSIYSLLGYKVDIINLIVRFRNYWLNKNVLIEEDFDHSSLTQTENKWTYKGNQFSSIIFCEGADVSANPFFKDLPIIPNKGQMMWIELDGLSIDTSLKHQVIVSSDLQRKWVGATYEWIFQTIEPTPDGLKDLKSKLEHFIHVPYNVISHHAGIRPTTADRRPIIQRHSEHKEMWVINGMGTKGASLAPTIVQEFMNIFEAARKESL